MEDRDRRRKRRREFFGDIFGDFDRDFEDMREYMDKMFERALRLHRDENERAKPFVYGFSVRVGPDGIPHIQEFGNTRKSLINRKNLDEGWGREPLTDVIESEDGVSITAELPGVEKKDINLEVAGNKLEIKVDTENRKYQKSIDLPDDVDPDSVNATYQNGVLDVTVKKLKPKKAESKKIDIE